MAEEGFSIPSILEGDLRKKQPGERTAAGDQAVAAYFDLVRILDPFDRPHDRNLEMELRQLFAFDRIEAWIPKRSIDRARRNGLIERCRRHDGADAATQIAVTLVERDECAGRAAQ